MGRWLALAFLLLPIVEIALFVEVGGLIGLWPTLGLVVLAAVAGAALMRIQGLEALATLTASLETGSGDFAPLAHRALKALAGLLLLIPGFFTDVLGLLLLVPAVRAAVIRRLGARIVARAEMHARSARGPSEVIDVDYEVVDEPRPRATGRSGWTRPQG
jgi:UPF0716 protein FxsA